jgi:hypothetical protein
VGSSAALASVLTASNLRLLRISISCSGKSERSNPARDTVSSETTSSQAKFLVRLSSRLAVLTASPIAVITAALPWPTTIIAVIEMSQSSCLVAGMLPDIERQPRKKQEPDPERLLGLHRW